MEFVHRTYEPYQTIAAIATPPGEGGVAIVRISGKNAVDVAEKVFSGPVRKYQSHTVHFGKLMDGEEVIDEVLLLVMLAPKSYTGEDTVEIHCHGGALISQKVYETILKAGARAALPGEFTFKAYSNGKIDLTQAEAVQELIAAKNTLAMKSAKQQLEGSLHKKIAQFQTDLTEIAAIVEAWVDFPEEGLEFATAEEIIEMVERILLQMKKLVETFTEGKALHTGFSLCLIGEPNVGKSSLLNALIEKNRAIVTPVPGTTRDVLEEDLHFSGLHFKLLDTAGIRATDDIVEKEGVLRSQKAAQEADLILCVFDAASGISLDPFITSLPQDKTLIVWNKMDLPHPDLPTFGEALFVSAKEATGIDLLKKAIYQKLWKRPPSKEEVILTNQRHAQALQNSVHALECFKKGLLSGISPEFLSSDLKCALIELGMIIGTNITEDILSAIFSKFCVGK